MNSSTEAMFIKSVDESEFMKTGKKLFELLDSIVEEIGEENVIQVITDNGIGGKKEFWTPCASHCIDLMLEDIGKLPNHRAISLVFYKQKGVSEACNHLICSISSFLGKDSPRENKSRKMSREWNANKLSKVAKEQEASKIILMQSFWKNVLAMGHIYEATDKAKETIMMSFNNGNKYKDVFEIINRR
ncbi:hypothetical protein CR513_54956, partial [Mucuna pruriens]